MLDMSFFLSFGRTDACPDTSRPDEGTFPTCPSPQDSYNGRMDTNTVLIRSQNVVEAEVDGQRVLMSPKDYSYFGLVGTGALVWDRIDDKMTVAEMASALAAEFSAPEDQVLTDVSDFVSALEAAGLITS